MYKKEAMEQHEKGFQKAIRKVEFFTKDLDLGLFDPFKDAKEGVLLKEEEIVVKEEATDDKQGEGKEAMMPKFRLLSVYFLLFFTVGFFPHRPYYYDNCYFSSMHMLFLL